MKYYKRCENHFYLREIKCNVESGAVRRLPMTYGKNKKNHREYLEDYEAILILLVKDDFYNTLFVALLYSEFYFLNRWYLSHETYFKITQSTFIRKIAKTEFVTDLQPSRHLKVQS